MNLLKGIIENKPNQFWYLLQHVLFRAADRIPHDQIFGDCFEEDMVRIAFLNGVEAVWDRYF